MEVELFHAKEVKDMTMPTTITFCNFANVGGGTNKQTIWVKLILCATVHALFLNYEYSSPFSRSFHCELLFYKT